MPRTKLAAPRKWGDDSPGPSPKKKLKKQRMKVRRRILPSTEDALLGSEPLVCTWQLPHHLSTATPLFLSSQNDEEPMVVEFADGMVPLDFVNPLIRTLVETYPRGQFYSLVLARCSSSELLIDLAVTSLPWEDSTHIIESLYDRDYSEFPVFSHGKEAETWGQFFKELSLLQAERGIVKDETLQHEGLVPELRGYQSAAVRWMMSREQAPAILDQSWLSDVVDEVPVRSACHSLRYNKYTGLLSEDLPEISVATGGILADEMGLGKTVITLALVLNHRRPPPSLPQQFVVKKRLECDSDSDTSDEDEQDLEWTLNQESRVDPDEEYKNMSPRPGRGQLKVKANEWYESKLAEMRTSQSVFPSIRASHPNFKCTCGERKRGCRDQLAACNGCGLRQHRQCVGFSPSYTYFCPPCWGSQPVVPSSTTLIVAPQPIFAQWLSEIARHAPSLRVYAYKGIARKSFVQPTSFLKYDVVVTTYDILSAETLYIAEAPDRRLRREQRFLRQTCPLTRVGWWRVVCDEAQLFESDYSRIQQMIPLLTAEHRWSVTGTPIQRTIADLFYLTQFIGLGALDHKPVWLNLLLKPYLSGCKNPLLSVLSQVFWRSSKEDVVEELGIPEQTFTHHPLNFSPIEEIFYDQEHQLSATKLREAIRKSGVDGSRTLDSLDRTSLRKILLPILNLRQACTHPQVVSGVSISSATGAANLGDLLTYLSRKAKLECEEALRRHIHALNGIAGLYCLQENWADAVECYRTVLRLTEEYKDNVKVDTLQRIHALANAAQVLSLHKEGIPPTLRDDSLAEEAKQIEANYRSKAADAFKASFTSYTTFSKELKEMTSRFESAADAYWIPICLSLRDFEQELVDKLTTDLNSIDLSEKASIKTFLGKIESLRGVEVMLRQWISSLEKHHLSATNALDTLVDIPTHILVQQATSCHLRTSGTTKKKCELCKVEKIMLDLECDLFNTNKKKFGSDHEKVMDGAQTKGSWKAHNAEKALVIMVNFAKSKCLGEDWALSDFKVHCKVLEIMKKEFKHLRAAWTDLNHVVQAEDELSMARLRLRIAETWETPPRTSALALTQTSAADSLHIVRQPQIPSMIIDLTQDRDFSYSDFKKKYGRMLYLENLGSRRNANPDPCPVCSSLLDKQWVVLECGHCFCISCVQTLCHTKIKCPVCREVTDARNLSFVDSCRRVEHNDVSVAGDFPTKVDAIVRTSLKLLSQDASTKILIFSTWPEVLKVLEKALLLNNVSLLRLRHGKHKEILETFRDPQGNVSVLLLPLKWGARGLNLVEATQVFLTEPIINPEEELQAIGRVHRIGQTKPTTVHRFLISGTIEEKIQTAVSAAKDKWSNKQMTLDDLQKLFVMPPRVQVPQ